jgi:hypothetical protein
MEGPPGKLTRRTFPIRRPRFTHDAGSAINVSQHESQKNQAWRIRCHGPQQKTIDTHVPVLRAG